jgi:hypothetical protein
LPFVREVNVSKDGSSWIRGRFPSRRDLFLAFMVCVVPVHIWTWILFFYKVPSYLLQLSISQTLGVFAYAQVFALFESAVLCGLIVLVAFLLPRRLFLDRFVPQAALCVFAITGWAISMQLSGMDFAGSEAAVAEMRPALLGWTVGWLVALAALSAAMHYWKALQKWLWAFADRVVVLSGFFLLVDAICLVVVVLRIL